MRRDEEHILRKVFRADMEKEDMTNENKIDRCVPARLEKYWAQSAEIG